MSTNKLKTVIDIAAAVAMILASAVLIWSAVGKPWMGKARSRADRPLVPAAPVSLQGASLRGNEGARLAVLIYSDFECPYCRAFAQDTLPALIRDYVDAGKVRLAFRHLPLGTIHPNALKAAEVAACAEVQGKFWGMHDWLFRAQAKFELETLGLAADAVGLDHARFERCVSGGSTRPRVSADLATAAALRVSVTPTLLVGRLGSDGRLAVAEVLTGARPYSVLVGTLDRLARDPRS